MGTKLQRLLARAEQAANAEFSYFAYGSNMNAEQIRRRCPTARLLGPARLRGYALAFGGYSPKWNGAVATVLPMRDSVVDGLLFRLSCADIAKLDRFEGHPFAYQRTPVLVRFGSGTRKAFTYVQPHDTFESWPPGPEYFTQILESYVEHEFEISPLVHAAFPRVFVYGSLKRGFSNHRLLDGARSLGKATTAPGFTMYSLGAFPGVVARGEGQIKGELYEVSAEQLVAIDRLEGHPRFYRRTLIQLEDGTRVETYLLRPEQVQGRSRVADGEWRKDRDR